MFKRMTALVTALSMTMLCLPIGDVIPMNQVSLLTASAADLDSSILANGRDSSMEWDIGDVEVVAQQMNSTEVEVPITVDKVDIGFNAFTAKLSRANNKQTNQYYKSINGVLFTKDGSELIRYPAGLAQKTYSIPESVAEIGGVAFDHCSKLESVKIPNTVTAIESSAFWGCDHIKTFNIPRSTATIAAGAFTGCSSLTSISVDTSNQYYRSIDGVLFTKDKQMIVQYPSGKQDSDYTIPDSVVIIEREAFSHCVS